LQPDQTEPNQIVQDQTVPDQEDLWKTNFYSSMKQFYVKHYF
jgi:hypothetical protein